MCSCVCVCVCSFPFSFYFGNKKIITIICFQCDHWIFAYDFFLSFWFLFGMKSNELATATSVWPIILFDWRKLLATISNEIIYTHTRHAQLSKAKQSKSENSTPHREHTLIAEKWNPNLKIRIHTHAQRTLRCSVFYIHMHIYLSIESRNF